MAVGALPPRVAAPPRRGIGQRIYSFFDPILPFDQQLDPMFGGQMPQSAPMQQAVSAGTLAPPPQITAGGPPLASPSVPSPSPQAAGALSAFAAPPRKTSAPGTARNWRENLAVLGAGLSDAGGGSGNLAGLRESWMKRDASTAGEARKAQLISLAQQTITDPREWVVFNADPEAWAKNAAEAYAPQVVAGGSSVFQGGKYTTAPRIEQVDDRFGTATIGPDGKPMVSYSDPRGPTFAEQTDRAKANMPMEIAPEATLFDPVTRQPVYTAPAKRELMNLGAGDTLVEIPGGGGGGSGVPRGIRNNNPGNIEDGAFAKSLPGYKGSDGRFAIFETPAAGQGAAVALLGSYGNRGLNTVQSIINRWAPPSENDSGAYANTVARAVGVRPDQPLNMRDPSTLQRLAGAMFQVENGQAVPMAGGARTVATGAPSAASSKPMAAALQTAEDKDLEALSTASGINEMLSGFVGQIDSGSLNFGPVRNVLQGAALATGTADESARNFGSFKAGLERLRNESLRLNTGVQTDGDAQRAWNELMGNLSDEKFVKQRLGEIMRLNERAVELKARKIQLRRERSKTEPLDGIETFVSPLGAPPRTGSRLPTATPGSMAQTFGRPSQGGGGGSSVTVTLPNGQTATVRRK